MGSYAWKSIIGSRAVIWEGMIWRIGNGHSVRIREDKWLSVKSNRSVISPLPTVALRAKVSSLTDLDLRGWNSTLVNQIFLPHEASVICGMPLSTRLPPDRIIWSLTPSGMFTTRSAYKLLVTHNATNHAGTSLPENQRQFWRNLWQLRVTNKLSTLLGMLAMMPCQCCQIWSEDTLPQMRSTAHAKPNLRTLFMPFGLAQNLNRFGAHYPGLNSLLMLIHQASKVFLTDLCRSRKTTGPRSSSPLLGCCGIVAMP